MLADFYSRGMTTVFPVGPFSTLSLIVFLAGSSFELALLGQLI